MIESCRTSLVSFKTSSVAATKAALRAAAEVVAVSWGARWANTLWPTKTAKRPNEINRPPARYLAATRLQLDTPGLICFDILIFRSYSPLNAFQFNLIMTIDANARCSSPKFQGIAWRLLPDRDQST